MSDYSWIGSLIGAAAKAGNTYSANNSASADYQKAYDDMLANLQARFGEYDALGPAGYQNITAQQLGPSALESIPQDLQSRQAQQEAMATLAELAQNGGLTLADQKALNDIQATTNRNNMARQKGLANQFAARGQLGSGAQLAMALDAQQNSAMNGNAAAESAAAQAQQRAMQAILQRGQMARQMGNDDYSRKSEAAKARDAIEARNAAARTDAAKSNNAYAGQAYQDAMGKLAGKTSLTNSMNQAVFGKGQTSANNTLANAGFTNHLVDGTVNAFGQKNTGGTDSTDNTIDYGDGNADEDAELNQNDDD